MTMVEAKQYTVRPLSRPARADLKDAFRIYVSPASLGILKLKSGDLCTIWSNGSQKGSAIAWPAPEKLQDTVVQTSKQLQNAYQLNLGDKIHIEKDEKPIPIINTAYVKMDGDLDDSFEKERWEWLLEDPLETAETLVVGLRLEDVKRKNSRHSFCVQRLEDGTGSAVVIGIFGPTSRVKIVGEQASQGSTSVALHLSTAGIGGLAAQMDEINEALRAYVEPAPSLPKPGGILIHGPSGTGKSLLLEKIAAISWGKVFKLDGTLDESLGEVKNRVRRIFQEARKYQSIIIIDHIDAIAMKKGREGSERSIAGTLRAEIEALVDAPSVVVLAATNCINGLDPTLLKPKCFEFKIAIPIPNAEARTEIIKTFIGESSHKDPILDEIGQRTHGFTGEDLYELMLVARRMPGQPSQSLTRDAVERALRRVRPTAMREVVLDVPKVRWTDIGGQESVKQTLRKTFEWPLKYPARMKRLGIQPRKGLLLYGPPGCSKTLTARAFATESGLNFIAVKGAEILNMYVGESERILRDIFAKARAASPSIIFFDEIDAIAGRRESQAGGLNVVTTLLNEMDGIEALHGVTILAATNNPEALDRALLRPGRIDSILYVGPPDLDARQQILRIRTAEMDIGNDVQLDELAQAMDGYTGAEMVSICEKAGERAFEESEMKGQEEPIRQRHFEWAISLVDRHVSLELRLQYENWAVGGTRG
ncbi:MAG: AAA+-type ATPase [Watsoniomyces obsoletus]|nr:MAG: AAA+-type ATPase [Watsoniomyces obsoletus]